jgi:phosphoribosylaminoimidazolecarboxamide formyltransferase/IMP cyclohydrolase
MTRQNARRALLSVSDKSGLVEFARGLAAQGFELISTGGTARALADAGLAVTEVAQETGFPEIMDGRVKTLHPKVHGALLGRAGVDDAVMLAHGIRPIELLVVNLYPFIESPGVENIDVGGPAMLRAAAKNHARVAAVVDPKDYAALLEALQGGSVPEPLRRRLAAKAFAHTAHYDAAVATWLGARDAGDHWPETLVTGFRKLQPLRYGENPHQHAAFYAATQAPGPSLATARQLQGKELSYNNIADADTALECVRQFETVACVIVKHANPCGAALADSLLNAYLGAYEPDTTSAFGGIIAFNRPVDGATAAAIVERQFVEVVVAPGYSPDARPVFAAKQNIRLLETGPLAGAFPSGIELRSIAGGLLAQSRDDGVVDGAALKHVTRRSPDAAELADLLFAWRICKYVKSNAIVFARGGRTVGIGAGQTSRVVSTRIAAMKAADADLAVAGCVMASDAFFPFRDGLDAALDLGVRAVIQPGGSLRDAEVIAAADERGVAMVFTGMRHFRH